MVGFGKLSSFNFPFFSQKLDWNVLSSVYSASSLQLFLADYSSLYVTKVVQISQEIDETLIPKYCQEQKFNVEAWFVIKDMIELVHKDFEKMRDLFLTNFTTSDYGNHTYAIYGNSYQHPLRIEMKEDIDYFLAKIFFILTTHKSF